MSIDDTIIRIANRSQRLGAKGYLFHKTSEPGIALSESDTALRQFVQDHGSKRYYVVGLGNTKSFGNLTSFMKMGYNGAVSIIAALTNNSSLLRHVGVDIEFPPKELTKDERSDLKVSIPGAIFDFIFPELISVGYGTKFGNLASTVSHLDNGDYWTIGEVHIGRNVFVGGKTLICPGVTIGDYAKINAGSVVVSDVPPGKVYGGSPAKMLGDRYIREVKLFEGVPRIVQKEINL